jgi:hypothetical protein
MAGWIEDPKAWSAATIGPHTLQRVRLHIDSIGRKIDEQQPKGTNKAYSEDQGSTLAKLTLEVWINSREYDAWRAIMVDLNPRNASSSTGPFELKHPEANDFGVKMVQIVAISSSAPTARSGKVYKIQLLEYVQKPKPVKKAPVKEFKSVNEIYANPNSILNPLSTTNNLVGMDALDEAIKNLPSPPGWGVSPK